MGFSSDQMAARGSALWVGFLLLASHALVACVVSTETNNDGFVSEDDAFKVQIKQQNVDQVVLEQPAPKGLFIMRGDNLHAALTQTRWPVRHQHHDAVELMAGLHERPHTDLGLELVEVLQQQGFKHSANAEGYHNPEQMHDAFTKLAAKYPSYAKFYSLTQDLEMPKTSGGREIFILKISDNVNDDEDEPNVLLVSNHHARELVVPELALHTATKLLESTDGGSADAKQLVDEHQIYILYTLNPDGLHIVWNEDAMQRKNGNQVDLNRNYPIGFDNDCGGGDYKESETYRGPKPFSEVETQTMAALQKSRSFAKLIDFHSYARQVRRNYGPCVDLPESTVKLFASHGDSIAKAMDYESSQSCCMGGDIHYAFNKHGTLSYLVETADEFQPEPSPMQDELERVYPGIIKLLEIKPSAFGHIVNADNAPVKGAELKVTSLGYSLGEISTPTEHGLYHLWLPEGHHKVQVKAQGYKTQTIELAVTTTPTNHKIILEKLTHEDTLQQVRQQVWIKSSRNLYN